MASPPIRAAPEYWWLYALLLSTMIPSLVNLVIGGTSLLRGVPGLPSLLLRNIPERGNVPKWDRAWIATVLTAQIAVGAALGIAAQVFLVCGHHRLRHAVLRPGAARHGPRRRRLQSAGAGGAALRGQPVARRAARATGLPAASRLGSRGDISLTAGRRMNGLAITIRPGQAERERRRDDPPNPAPLLPSGGRRHRPMIRGGSGSDRHRAGHPLTGPGPATSPKPPFVPFSRTRGSGTAL